MENTGSANSIYKVFLKTVEQNILRDLNKKRGIKCRIKKFRRSLFKDEFLFLRQISSPEIFDDMASYISNIVKDSEYIYWSDFEGFFMKTIEGIIKYKSSERLNTLYSYLVDQAYQCYLKKIDALERMPFVQSISSKDKFWLIFLCYIYNLIRAFDEGKIEEYIGASEDKALIRIHELVEDYYMDFIFPFTYIKRKPHVILRGDDENIINHLLKYHKKERRDELYKRYWNLRNKLRSQKFPFDISKPIIREKYRRMFGEKWDSIILGVYPASREKFEPHIDAFRGREYVRLRPHTTIYIELLLNIKRTEYMLLSNKDLRNLRKYEEDAIRRTLKELLGMSDDEIKRLISESGTYTVDTEAIIKMFKEKVYEGPDATEKALKELKQGILKLLTKERLERKKEIESFIKSLKLAGVTLKAISGKRVLAEFKVSIEYASPLSEKGSEKEVVSKAKEIFATFKKIKSYYEPYNADIQLILHFEGYVGKRKVRITVSKNRRIIYNKLSRDLASELTYVMYKALSKG